MQVTDEMVEAACVAGDFADRTGMRRALEAVADDIATQAMEAYPQATQSLARADAAEQRVRELEESCGHLTDRIDILNHRHEEDLAWTQRAEAAEERVREFEERDELLAQDYAGADADRRTLSARVRELEAEIAARSKPFVLSEEERQALAAHGTGATIQGRQHISTILAGALERVRRTLAPAPAEPAAPHGVCEECGTDLQHYTGPNAGGVLCPVCDLDEIEGIHKHNAEPAPAEPATSDTRTVRIPACEQHEGLYALTLTLPWRCLVCGGPRGEPHDAVSFDGSRRLHVHGWDNPCGHVERYAMVRGERLAPAPHGEILAGPLERAQRTLAPGDWTEADYIRAGNEVRDANTDGITDPYGFARCALDAVRYRLQPAQPAADLLTPEERETVNNAKHMNRYISGVAPVGDELLAIIDRLAPPGGAP